MNEKRALSLGLASVLLWSTVATAFKLTLAELNPLQMVTVASIVSALALLVICAAMDKLKLIVPTLLANPFYYLLLGLINPLAYYLILFKAYSLLPASQAQAINYSWAITLTLMAALFLGQRIRKQDWIACAMSYLGVVVIATKGDLLGLQFESPLGLVSPCCRLCCGRDIGFSTPKIKLIRSLGCYSAFCWQSRLHWRCVGTKTSIGKASPPKVG